MTEVKKMPRMLRNWIICGVLVAIALSYALLLAVDPLAAQALAREDGPIENLGAAFSLVAAGWFVASYFSSAGQDNIFFGKRTKRNLWFLGLALLMFVCAGEEVSWGQRIFGWETPEALEKLNAQGETNIHNLWPMQATNPDGTRKSGLALLLNFNRLYSIFWLVYCVVLPLAVSASEYVARARNFLGLPVPPIAVGSLFVANYLIFLLIVGLGGLDSQTISAFDELKETNYAFAFSVLGFCFFIALPTRSYETTAE